jgi:two-component system response regulator GlrR
LRLVSSELLPSHDTALVRTDARTGGLLERSYSLAVLSGEDRGKALTLRGTHTVGTSPDTDLPLTDPTVSRYHLELQARATGVRVRDLDSTNGTFLAGVRIREATIERDTTLLVGSTPVRIALEERSLGKPRSTGSAFGGALGECERMRGVFGVLERVSATDSTVLLCGETGTGKELLARGIHDASARATGPFVVVHCGAVVRDLVESELFGHAVGAFTGAVGSREGAFLSAHGGTLLLDEVGELPVDLQPKLLRALDTGAVKRLGADEYTPVDVRIVATTHRDLEAEIAAERFRGDLYYRLAVVTVQVPPLRERREDIPLLTSHFLAEAGRKGTQLPAELIGQLAAHDWPGNVRELQNAVERFLAGAAVELGAPAPPWKREVDRGKRAPYKQAKEDVVEAFTREYVTSLFQQCGRNLSEMARVAGIGRNHVRRLVRRYKLKADE